MSGLVEMCALKEHVAAANTTGGSRLIWLKRLKRVAACMPRFLWRL